MLFVRKLCQKLVRVFIGHFRLQGSSLPHLSLSLSLSSWTPIGASLMPEGVCVCAIACNGPPALKTKARSAVHVGSKNVKNLLNVLL